jgi:hypothetical protein
MNVGQKLKWWIFFVHHGLQMFCTQPSFRERLLSSQSLKELYMNVDQRRNFVYWFCMQPSFRERLLSS